VVDVDAFERGGEAVGIAFASHFPVTNDVDAGALHVADRDQRGVVLRLFQERRRDAPQVGLSHARYLGAQLGAVDQPPRLWITADDRGGEDFVQKVARTL